MIKKMTKQVENVLKMMMMAHTYEHKFPGTVKSLLNFSFEMLLFFPYIRKIRVWGKKMDRKLYIYKKKFLILLFALLF